MLYSSYNVTHSSGKQRSESVQLYRNGKIIKHDLSQSALFLLLIMYYIYNVIQYIQYNYNIMHTAKQHRSTRGKMLYPYDTSQSKQYIRYSMIHIYSMNRYQNGAQTAGRGRWSNSIFQEPPFSILALGWIAILSYGVRANFCWYRADWVSAYTDFQWDRIYSKGGLGPMDRVLPHPNLSQRDLIGGITILVTENHQYLVNQNPLAAGDKFGYMGNYPMGGSRGRHGSCILIVYSYNTN